MNTSETDRAPDGYVECPKGCGRWKPCGSQGLCWECHFAEYPSLKAQQSSYAATYPDWTPPLPVPAKAAPKVHPPREAGQRWRCESGESLPREFTLLVRTASDSGWKTDDILMSVGDHVWTVRRYTMTLLSPAPVAKPAETPATGKPLCPTCNRLESQHTNPLAHKFGEPAEPPVAQGATPLECDIARDTHAGPVLMRWIKVGQCAKATLTPACEQCHVLSERAGRFGGVFTATVLSNPAIPERLTKAQLASDYCDDCLPEAGR